MPPEFPFLDIPNPVTHFGLGLAIGETFNHDIRDAGLRRRQTIPAKDYNDLLLATQPYASAIKTHLPQTWEVLLGISLAVDIDRSEIVLANTHELHDPTERCLTIVSPHQNTVTVGHLEEWNEEGADKLLYVLKVKVQGDYYTQAMLGLCYWSELPWTAISLNSSGLVQGVNSLKSYHTGPGVPRIAIASKSAEAASPEEAEQLISSLPRASAFNHVFVQNRRIKNVEAVNDHLAVTNLEGQTFIHGNAFVNDSLKNRGPAASKTSQDRYRRAVESIKPEMTVDQMKRALDQLSHPDTLASVIVEPDQRRLSIRRHQPGAQFITYHL